MLWLPVDTPYGNLSLKFATVWQRIGQANLRLQESYTHWEQLVALRLSDGVDHGSRHRFATEEAVFMLRRAADEMVALIWLLQTRLSTDEYPSVVKIDSISGALVGNWLPFEDRRWLLDTLNRISNAHKHSFIQSDLNVAGAAEPCVSTLALDRNRLSQEAVFQNVSLAELADEFTLFVRDAVGELSALRDGLRETSAG